MKNTFFLLLFTLTVFVIGCNPDDTDPDAPSIIIQDATLIETDNDQTVGITVSLSKTSEVNVVFSYSTVDGTATAGADFEGVSDKLFTISPDNRTANFEILLKGDDEQEGNETFDIIFSNVEGGNMVNEKITVTISDDEEAGNVKIPMEGGGYEAPTSYPNLTLVWEDNFDGTRLGSHWTHEIGTGSNGWGNNELQHYRAGNTTIANGYCIIEAREESVSGSNYTSSRVVTKNAQSFRYGRIDIRAALPEGQGIWPALWMLGDNFEQVGWPQCGEIDIMEIVGHEPNKLHGTVHWADVNNTWANYGGAVNSTFDLSDQFNVFSIIWDQYQIKWLLNGTQFHSIGIGDPQFDEFREEFFFIMNVAVGGNWPGNPNATTVFPQRMIVDYIRVFQQ